jgi:hypothetical protein
MDRASSDWTQGRNDRDLELEAAAYLVRHAHAGSKRAWIEPDVLRPL